MIPTSTPADRIQYSDGIQKLQRYPSQKMIKVTERLPRVEAIMEAFQFLLLM
jgi:hypothetical protein